MTRSLRKASTSAVPKSTGCFHVRCRAAAKVRNALIHEEYASIELSANRRRRATTTTCWRVPIGDNKYQTTERVVNGIPGRFCDGQPSVTLPPSRGMLNCSAGQVNH